MGSVQNVIMFDMGAGSSTATLVHYSSFSGKEFGKTKTFGQFEVSVDERERERVGANR